MKNPRVERLPRRDRIFAFSGLAVATAISWAYMLNMAWRPSGSGMENTGPCLMRWGPWNFLHMFIMWVVMMVAIGVWALPWE